MKLWKTVGRVIWRLKYFDYSITLAFYIYASKMFVDYPAEQNIQVKP